MMKSLKIFLELFLKDQFKKTLKTMQTSILYLFKSGKMKKNSLRTICRVQINFSKMIHELHEENNGKIDHKCCPWFGGEENFSPQITQNSLKQHFLYFFILLDNTALKIRILLAYTGQLIVSRQATFLSGHKITVLILLVCFSTGQSALDVQKVI